MCAMYVAKQNSNGIISVAYIQAVAWIVSRETVQMGHRLQNVRGGNESNSPNQVLMFLCNIMFQSSALIFMYLGSIRTASSPRPTRSKLITSTRPKRGKYRRIRSEYSGGRR